VMDRVSLVLSWAVVYIMDVADDHAQDEAGDRVVSGALKIINIFFSGYYNRLTLMSKLPIWR